MNLRILGQGRDQAPVALPGVGPARVGRRQVSHAPTILARDGAVALARPDAGRCDDNALAVACRTLSRTPATALLAISVTGVVGQDGDGIRSLRALVGDLAQAYGFDAEVDVDGGSFAVRFSRG